MNQCPEQRPAVFVARSLCKTYGSGDSAIFALHDLDLDIYEGEFVVLLGPSGSGKSTLLNILGGLDTATSGRAAWRDHELTGSSEEELTRYRREHVGFIFQFYNLIPSLTVLENVQLVAEIAADPIEPKAALELVGLGGQAPSFSFPAFGRRAATRRRRARHRQAPRRAPLRRADGRARRGDW